MKRKRIVSVLLIFAALFSLAGCGSQASATQDTESADTAAKKSLVVYFAVAENSGVADAVTSASINPDSDPVHGYTRTVADWAAEYLGADMFSVQTVFDYPTEYQPTTDIALNEQ